MDNETPACNDVFGHLLGTDVYGNTSNTNTEYETPDDAEGKDTFGNDAGC